jgi:hypothetical protein
MEDANEELDVHAVAVELVNAGPSAASLLRSALGTSRKR